MNILYIAHRIPYPPNKGDKIRSFHQIRYLSKRHTIYLACMIDEKDDLQYVKTLEKYCASVDAVYRGRRIGKILALSAILAKRTFSVTSFYSAYLKKKIYQRLNSGRFDRIIVFSSVMAEYVKNITNIPKIMDFVDVDSDKWRLYADYHPFPFSWIYRIEAKRLARYEQEVAKSFDRSIFVSEKEAALFQQRVTDQSISVIPNGVDLDYFAPNGNESHSEQLNIIFTGAMDYFPNVDAVKYFCNEIFPLVRKIIPKARFYIVGRNPTHRVKALGHQPNVNVTGSVPDVRPYLMKAKVAVAPFRIARGIQNKVLEAMSMGLPVVGTSNAFQGTQAKESNGVRIANDPQGFAKLVITLLIDDDLRRRCSLEARNYVELYHRWEDHGERLESLLQSMS